MYTTSQLQQVILVQVYVSDWAGVYEMSRPIILPVIIIVITDDFKDNLSHCHCV